MKPYLLIVISCVCTSVHGESRYCGSDLTTILELVCGGQFFGEMYKKSSVHSTNSAKSINFVKKLYPRSIEKRRVADECCVQSCTFETLTSYCAYNVDVIETTTKNSVTNVPRAPVVTSANVEQPEKTTSPPNPGGGVRSRQRGRWFFLHGIGHNPIRQPFMS